MGTHNDLFTPVISAAESGSDVAIQSILGEVKDRVDSASPVDRKDLVANEEASPSATVDFQVSSDKDLTSEVDIYESERKCSLDVHDVVSEQELTSENGDILIGSADNSESLEASSPAVKMRASLIEEFGVPAVMVFTDEYIGMCAELSVWFSLINALAPHYTFVSRFIGLLFCLVCSRECNEPAGQSESGEKAKLRCGTEKGIVSPHIQST
jgi:hypothetical protein